MWNSWERLRLFGIQPPLCWRWWCAPSPQECILMAFVYWWCCLLIWGLATGVPTSSRDDSPRLHLWSEYFSYVGYTPINVYTQWDFDWGRQRHLLKVRHQPPKGVWANQPETTLSLLPRGFAPAPTGPRFHTWLSSHLPALSCPLDRQGPPGTWLGWSFPSQSSLQPSLYSLWETPFPS